MNKQRTEIYFLSALLLLVAILTFFIFKPFLYALILAVVFATALDPIHRRVLALTKNRRGLSSFISTLLFSIIIIVPIAFISTQIFKEATGVYGYIKEAGAIDLNEKVNSVVLSLQTLVPIPANFSFDINSILEKVLAWLIDHSGSIFKNFAQAALSIFVFIIALFSLFKERINLRARLIALSPLQDTHDEAIFKKLAGAVNSVVRGSLSVALIQGFLTSIGFYIFGIPNPTLWGSAAAIASLIPGVGTSLVLVPGIIYLFVTSSLYWSVGFLIWSVLAVGLIDNLLGPKLVERGLKVHPFLILLSILGGITFFGPIGLVLGPLVLSLFVALIEIYLLINKN